MLLTDKKGKLQKTVNDVILSNDTLIFSDRENYNTLGTEEKYKLLSKDSLQQAERNDDVRIETNTFCYKSNISYTIKQTFARDKGSPFRQYININLTTGNLLDFKNEIRDDGLSDFNSFLNSYTTTHREEILKNYQNELSERSDQLIESNYAFMFNNNYSLSDVKYSIDESSFSHFCEDGAVFGVWVVDSNPRIENQTIDKEEYLSFIVIPYDKLRIYMKNKDFL
jgi:hypothetical protein